MNAVLLKELGTLSVPPCDNLSSFHGNSSVVNSVGDLLVLHGKGEVSYTSVREDSSSDSTSSTSSSSSSLMKKLPLYASEEVDMTKFRHISVNQSGSLLLLWSTCQVAVVEIPRTWLEKGNMIEPKNQSSTTSEKEKPFKVKLLSPVKSYESNPIVKAVFHPLCDHCCVVLQESEFISLFDLRNEELNQTISLPPKLRFVSFTFGPEVEWLRFTIFLVTSDNKLYFLCPIIPRGTVVSSSVVSELWTWFDSQRNRIKKRDNLAEARVERKYFDVARKFLLQTVGSATDVERELLVLAGELTKLDIEDSVELISSEKVDLQGPLELHKGAKHVTNQSEDFICDISTPIIRSSGISPPVVFVSYKSGQVDVLLVDAQDEMLWFVNPGWKWIDSKLTIGQYPVLRVADTFVVDNVNAIWKLVPDPGFPHQCFCTNTLTSASFLISSSWLNRALHLVTRALEGCNGQGELDEEESNCLPIHTENKRNVSSCFSFQDIFAGHVFLLRLESNEFVAVNMTVHAKLCEMQQRLRNSNTISLDENLVRDFRTLTSDDALRWRHSEELILSIAKGLQQLPELEIAVDSELDVVGPQLNAQKDKMLTEAAQKLEQNVLHPMTQLHDATTFNTMMVQQMYEVQREIIEGHTNRTTIDSHNLSNGLVNLIHHLVQDNEKLIARLKRLESTYNDQRDRVDATLRIVYGKNSQLTPTEKEYSQQLDSWKVVAEHMDREIGAIKKNCQSQIFLNPTDANLTYGSTPTPTPSVSATSRRTPNIFSPSMPALHKSTFLATPGKYGTPSKLVSSPSLESSSMNASISWSQSRVQQTPSKLSVSSPYTKFTPKHMGRGGEQVPEQQQSSTVELSEEEQRICLELLNKQTELIEESKKKIEDLQRKVDKAKKAKNVK